MLVVLENLGAETVLFGGALGRTDVGWLDGFLGFHLVRRVVLVLVELLEL